MERERQRNEQGMGQAAPSSLSVLVVCGSGGEITSILSILESCSYQVEHVTTTSAAIHLLKRQQHADGAPRYDLILKHHDPPNADAKRLLRRLSEDNVLKQIPVVVFSSLEEREVQLSCLQLGAAEYLVSPLRLTEVRHLWARVYWWRRAIYVEQQATLVLGKAEQALPELRLAAHLARSQSSGESEETNRSQDNMPKTRAQGKTSVPEPSGEGSAPNGSGSGSRAGAPLDGNGNSATGNGNSATKMEQGSNHPYGSSGAGVGNSASKEGNGLSGGNGGGSGNGGSGNGGSRNGASTSKNVDGTGALQGTAEGGKQQAQLTANGSGSVSGTGTLNLGQSTNMEGQQLHKHSDKDGEATPSAVKGRVAAATSPKPHTSSGLDSGQKASATSLELQPSRTPSQPGSQPRSAEPAGFRVYSREVCLKRKLSANTTGATTKEEPSQQQPRTTEGKHPRLARLVSLVQQAESSAPTSGHISGPATAGSDETLAGMSGQPHSSYPYAAHFLGRPPASLGNPGWPQTASSPFGNPASSSQQQQAAKEQAATYASFYQQAFAAGLPGQMPSSGHSASLPPLGEGLQQDLRKLGMLYGPPQSAKSSLNASPSCSNLPEFQKYGLTVKALPPARDAEDLAVQQQQLALVYQQHYLLQQYSLAAAAAAASAGAGPGGPSQFSGWRPGAALPWPGPNRTGLLPPSQNLGGYPTLRMPKQSQLHHSQQHQSQQQAQQQDKRGGTKSGTGGAEDPSSAQRASSSHMQSNLQGVQNLQPVNGRPQHPQVGSSGPTSTLLPSGGWGSMPGGPFSSTPLAEPTRRELRLQALQKFKQKKKNLCFAKTIRYESRRQLAEARPRVKGQFVRSSTLPESGLSTDLATHTVARTPAGPTDKARAVLGLVEAEAQVKADAEGTAAEAEADAVAAAQREEEVVAEDDVEANVVNSRQELDSRAPANAVHQSQARAAVRAAQAAQQQQQQNAGQQQHAIPQQQPSTDTPTWKHRGSSDSGSNSPDMKGSGMGQTADNS